MNHLRAAVLLLIAALPATGRAQERAITPEDPLVARGHVVDPASGEHAKVPGIKGHAAICRPHQDDVILAGDRLVDLRGRQLLTLRGGDVALRDLSGKELWRRDLGDAGLAQKATLADCWLHRARVLVRAGDRVVALDRATGEVSWRSEAGPTARALVGGDLWICAGSAGDAHELRVRSVQNGAQACRAELRAAPRQLCHAAFGVAVLEAGGVEVFDAFGPRRFVVDGRFDEVAAVERGWLLREGLALRALDRDGALRWQTDAASPRFLDRHRLHVTGTGALLVVSDDDISDSGAHVQRIDAGDGSILWSETIEGLGIPHSKYRHETYARARGDAVDVVCQGSGGAFVVTLDLSTGEQQQRIRLP